MIRMKRRLSKSVILIAVAALTLVGAGVAQAGGPIAGGPAAPAVAAPASIEAEFAQPGPWDVAKQEGAGCCDASGHEFDLWYPADLGADGGTHPIITWGNGTLAVPQQYDYLLTHLASWGFVVVAAHNTNTDSGQEMLQGVDYLRAQNADPSSIFHQRLDTGNIGAMGHSQGAVGALNAATDSGGAIKTAIPIELPGQFLCTLNTPKLDPAMTTCADPTRLTTGSVLYINGSDSFISPSSQPLPVDQIGVQSVQGYFEATPDSVDKAMATLIGPNHNDIQGQPGCTPDNPGCIIGVQGFLGLLTAWNMGELQGDAHARSAFTEGTGQFYSYPTWINQASNIAG